MILAIDTSSPNGSMALQLPDGRVFTRSGEPKQNYSIRLFRWLDEIQKESGVNFRELEAVAVASGPGLFTGLRIGVATAKGIAMGAECPIIAVPSLQAIAESAEKPPASPVELRTRWQGTMMERGFLPSACPTARAALGEPTLAASSP